MKNKKGLEVATSCSSGYKASSENSLFSDVLPGRIWWGTKNASAQANSLNYSTFICPFESERGG